ncbi:MAG: glycerophosphodiester phosphodiesterase family protein, partial [Sphingobacterium sp.]
GPSPGYPENSLPTFARVAKSFPTIIECDVVMSKDSVLVLMHDETLDRTTNGSGAIKDKSFHELSTMRLKDTEGMLTKIGIPTLEEALLWGKDKTIFTLDIKRSVPYEKVIGVIRRTQTEANSVIITYSPAQAAIVNQLAPDLMISTTIRNPEDLSRIDDLGVPTNRLVAFVGTSEPDPALYDSLQKRGVKSILGTMGNLDRSAKKSGYQRYADFIVRGASIISTDRPFEVQKALDFYINKREIRSPSSVKK